MTYRPVPELIGDVVDVVRASAGLPDVDAPYFDYGTHLEVVNRLTQKTNNPDLYNKKYPLIWMLIKDSLEEEVDYKKNPNRLFKDATIIFCVETDKNYSSKERLENSIQAILRPLYDLFMYHLRRNKMLISADYRHRYFENLYWGRNGLYGREGNVFNDRIDAVVIDKLDLRVKEIC